MNPPIHLGFRVDPSKVRVSVRRDGQTWTARIESRSDPEGNWTRSTHTDPIAALTGTVRTAADFMDGVSRLEGSR